MPDVFNAPSSSHKRQHKNHRHIDDYSEIMRQERPSKSYFKAFLPKPEKTAFDTQTTEEKIVLLLRQHPITLFKQVAIIITALLLPLLSRGSFFADFLPPSFILALNLGWYMLVVSYTLATFLIWFFSVFIITDERIIDVDFVSLLFKDVSAAKIDAIQDISSKTSGFLASIVNYGTVYIQTAGEQREIQFENIPQPAKVASLLNELMLEEEREKIEGRVQ
jgi:uncharacterized membrane protein YdbT with pleckstrin-like domain